MELNKVPAKIEDTTAKRIYAVQAQAEELIRKTGNRVTSGRVRVLAALLAERLSLTHHEIEERLNGEQRLDRVTLYRVLEWLSNKGLVYKMVCDDRVWRFQQNIENPRLHQHAYFKCTHCAKNIWLDSHEINHGHLLPSGYSAQEVTLMMKGLCVKCRSEVGLANS